jgi:hypothetical protein
VNRPALLLALATVAGTLTACGSGGHHDAQRAPVTPVSVVSPAIGDPAGPASPTSPASPTNPYSPLSGRPARAGLPVLVVKVDNVLGAFPQAGLNDADLVYVEQVEGGLTRLAAVFSSRLPRRIGPVRSARTDNIQLLQQFGRPAIAFSGANDLVLRAVRSAALRSVDVDIVPSAYERVAGHPAPHNLFIADPAALVRAGHPDGAKFIELTFADQVTGGRPAARAVVTFRAAQLQFDYVNSSRRWQVSQDGAPKVLADGNRVEAGTVILQEVQTLQDPNGHITPFNQSIGGGPSAVLRDGRVLRGTWRRSTVAAGTHYRDADGKDIALRPGVTWIVLVPPGVTSSVTG